MPKPSTDRNLLFGILAVQMDFISRDELIVAMNAWVLQKSKSLGLILLEHKALTPDTHMLLEAVVEKHLALHGDDAEKSLAAVSSVGSLRGDLEQIVDPEVQASLAIVSADPYATDDPYATVGTPTSTGLRFRIVRPHAKGGLGEVFVAVDEKLHREVALKEIQDRHADNRDSRSRFLVEAEITGGLEHPGIVPVYGLGQYADGRPFYAMRFIRGDSLQEAINKFYSEPAASTTGDRAVQFRNLLRRLIDVCNAIQYAHDRGVLHRDLKPGNIMLGKYGETLVVDWGLAKATGQREPEAQARENAEPTLRPASASGSAETIAGTRIGTPAYMSPEQAAGQLDLLGPASDVYGLGAVLYTILTGKRPIEDKDVGALLKKAQEGDIPRPRTLKADVPAPLEAICLKAMKLAPANRYASPRALADDVEHWLADEPVTAWPEPMMVRAGRWARRNRTLVTSAVAVLLVLAVGSSTAALVIGGLYQRLETANATLSDTNTKLDGALIAAKKAADAEKLAAELALKRLGHIEKANVLMESIFTDIDPRLEKKGGPLLIEQLRDRLLATADKLDEQAIGDPLTVARLQNFLGNTLLNLGEHGKAVDLHLRALATRKSLLDHDHVDTLDSMNSLAAAYLANGQRDKALPLFQETFAKKKAKLGPDHSATLTSMNNLAAAYKIDGQLANALPLFKQAFETRKGQFGPDHHDTLASMNNLAEGYRAAGKVDLALPLYREAFEMMTAKLGPNHPDTLTSMNNLASGYQDAGKLDLALSLYLKAFDLMKAKLGPNHPDTLSSMNNLAEGYRVAGRLDLALPLHQEALEMRKAKLGYDNPDTLTSMHNLANCLWAAGKLDLALPLFKDTLKLRKDKLRPHHSDTLKSMHILAKGYGAAAQLELALPLYEETLRLSRVELGFDHPDTLTIMNNLAFAYWVAKRLNDSIPLFEETLKLREKKLGRADPDTQVTVANLGVNYRDFGRHKEALPLLEEAYGASRTIPTLRWVGAQLLDGYVRANQPAKANALLTEVLASARKTLPKDGPQLAGVLAQCGLTLLQLQAFAEAQSLLRECLAIRQKSQPDVWSTFNTQSVLGGALLGQKKFSDAEPLLLQGYEGMQQREKTIPLQDRDRRLQEAMGRLAELFDATRQREDCKLQGKLTDDKTQIVHERKLTAGKAVVVVMSSNQFDTLLRLQDANGKLLAENDNIDATAKNLNSRIWFMPQADGVYRLIATSYQQKGRGEYDLIIRQYGPTKPK